MGTTVSPTRSVPASGASCPMIILNSVLLPAPLGPTMPTSMQQHNARCLLHGYKSTGGAVNSSLQLSIAHKPLACSIVSR